MKAAWRGSRSPPGAGPTPAGRLPLPPGPGAPMGYCPGNPATPAANCAAPIAPGVRMGTLQGEAAQSPGMPQVVAMTTRQQL